MAVRVNGGAYAAGPLPEDFDRTGRTTDRIGTEPTDRTIGALLVKHGLNPYDEKVRAAFHQANPWVHDWNRVRVGLEVVIPSVPTAEGSQIESPPSNTSTAGAKDVAAAGIASPQERRSALAQGGREQSPSEAARPARPVTSSAKELAAQRRTLHEAEARRRVEENAPVAPTDAKYEDRIVMLGMNKGTAPGEARAMRRQGTQVDLVGEGDSRQGMTTVGGRTYDLSDQKETEAFGLALGLDDKGSKVLSEMLMRRDPKARDDIAGLARAFAESENGSRPFGRLALSGHSSGENLSGKDNGELLLDDVRQIAELFPKAAARVEDVKLAACYLGTRANHERMKEWFPNLRTSAASDGKAALARSGAETDLARWEEATRGAVSSLRRDYSRGTHRSDSISVWSANGGFTTRRPDVARGVAEDAYQTFRQDVEDYRRFGNGGTSVPDRLTAHYDAIQALLGRKDVDDASRARLTEERDWLVRLRHEDEIRDRFGGEYREEIRTAFSRAGVEPPMSLAKMPRKDLIARLESLEKVGREKNDADILRFASRMRAALVDMSPDAVPFDWIG